MAPPTAGSAARPNSRTSLPQASLQLVSACHLQPQKIASGLYFCRDSGEIEKEEKDLAIQAVTEEFQGTDMASS